MEKELLKQEIQKRLAKIHTKLDNAQHLAEEIKKGFEGVLADLKSFQNNQKTIKTTNITA